MKHLVLFAIVAAQAAAADTLVAARTIPAQSIIGASDLLLQDGDTTGGTDDPLLLVGMEARTALYAGRPVLPADVGFPAIVDRNQIVPIIYDMGGLTITTDGRALGRAGAGETILVMNLTSRTTVTAQIRADGAAYVSR
ncbi:flagella basal body P-ring formation protein FlgA [Loktanella fryxellensis]|uniref:Flagella basal body P-ring formation protein FlgA n=1 Tax=Loktanella fryxellensis TaxID=245187 RepID=A0A1H7ZSW9_9RHOB|nr:flagellar basal body P-ring formation chaperone FlgA [Loktanella fryxellensis]SEM60579.1 flagella basal body P-ring formation protein FlgA [Loktanella fryxellensis]